MHGRPRPNIFTVTPKMPSSPRRLKRGWLNFSSRLNCSACGSTSFSTKERSMERSWACSSLGLNRSKEEGGLALEQRRRGAEVGSRAKRSREEELR
jgi:hypothetical protein